MNADGCLDPPGLNTGLTDMGAYGGQYNCEWGLVYVPNITRDILGVQDMLDDQIIAADQNNNGKIDVGDVIIGVLNQ
jgi:hypothetical protein